MNRQEKQLREQMGSIHDEMESIIDKADEEGRELTQKEQKNFDALHNDWKAKKRELNNLGSTSGKTANVTQRIMGRMDLANEQPKNENAKWVDPNTGKEIRVLQPNDSLYERDSGFDDFDMAAAIRGLATGDYSGAQNEIRAMDLSGNAALVPTPVSQRLIDRARDMMVLNRLGMQTVPMSSSTLTFARVDSDPTPEWKSENNSFSNSDVGISGVKLTAKTVICGVTLSHELASDSPNASQVVEDTIAAAIASEIDRAGLLGSGTDPEPQGIFGHSGVTDTALGATPTYDDFSNLYFRLANSNEQPNGLVTSSRTMQTLDQLKDNNGRYLQPPQSWNNFAKMTTNAIPNDQGAGTDESLAVMGNFRQLFQGIRENLQIEVSRTASDADSNAWSDLQVKIRVFTRIDFALGRPGAFQTLSGILS